MSTTDTSATSQGQLDLEALERSIGTSTLFAWAIVLGLPPLGIAAALTMSLPLFTALVSGAFLFGAALVTHRAITSITGTAVRVIIASRLAVVLALASLLALTTGAVWMALVSAVLVWLVADRLMGRGAIRDLWSLLHA